MKEFRQDFSQYQFYKAEWKVNADTSHDPEWSHMEVPTALSATTPIYEKPIQKEDTIFDAIIDNDQFTFHMRNLMQDFYRDILDNEEIPTEEKPELTTKIIKRSQIKGTKDSNEFRNKKLKKADKALAQYKQQYDNPAKYFEDNPPFVCEIPDENGTEAYALLRGHHEMRRAGNFKVGEIPCEVITSEQLASALNAYEPPKQIGRVTPLMIKSFLNSQMVISRESFQSARAMSVPISKPRY